MRPCQFCGRVDKQACRSGLEADECGRRAMFDQFGERPMSNEDVLHADIAELLTTLGMGDHARPQSPHEVFQDALSVLKARLGPPSEPAPRLNRREKATAIAEAAANRWDAFQDQSGIGWLVESILALKTDEDERVIAWANRSVREVQDTSLAETDRLQAGIAEIIAVCEQDARDQDHNATQTGWGKCSEAYAEGRGTACKGIAVRLRALLDTEAKP